jgi:hypothetical protein
MADKALVEVLFYVFMKGFEFCRRHGVDSTERGRHIRLESDLIIIRAMGG